MEKLRCAWCEKDDLYRDYHDLEWGKPVYDDETIFYFRAVLSDPRGLNIRNDVCHGIVNADRFNFSYSLLVMHIIFLLARVRDDISPSI